MPVVVDLGFGAVGMIYARSVKGGYMKRTVEIVYTEYWVIRVIRDTKASKTVTREIEYPTSPTEQDIVDVLLRCDKNEFISVAHNYRLGG